MSGLVVRPGDTLFLRVSGAGPGEVAEIEASFQAEMPGVRVHLTGHEGGPFVYRPNPPDPVLHPCCHSPFRSTHATWCPINPMSTVDNPVTGEPLGYVREIPGGTESAIRGETTP